MAQNPPNPARARLPSGNQGARGPGGRYGYRMEYRREFASKLTEERAARSDVEQIKLLDKRLGDGVGATKERARLKSRIEAAKNPPKKSQPEKGSDATKAEKNRNLKGKQKKLAERK